MPVTPTYPGVYIEEVPSGVHTITGVATSIAAFIGFFKEGPMDKAAQIFGMTDFNRIYGGLDKRSEACYAISQFFLNGGTEAHVVRVASTDPADATNTPTKASIQIKAGTSQGAGIIIKVEAKNEGEWGNNLRVVIDNLTSDPASRFNLYVNRYVSTSFDAAVVKGEQHLNLSVVTSDARYFVDVINDKSHLIEVKDDSSAGSTNLPAPNGTYSKEISLMEPEIGALKGHTFKVEIGGIGPYTATLTWDADPKNLRELRAYVEKAIRNADSEGSVAFTGATVTLVGENRYLLQSGRGESYSPADIIDISKDGTDTLALNLGFTGTGICENVQEYVVGSVTAAAAQTGGVSGKDGIVPDADAIKGIKNDKSGLYALEDVDLFNILCIPDTADLSDLAMIAVVSKALKYCEDRRAFMIIDIPKDVNTVEDIKDWLDTHGDFRSKNAALYFPSINIPDAENEYRNRLVGASGTMAGIYAKIDSTRGVWKAPAGIEAGLAGVSKLDVLLTDPQNGTLNPLAINCIRNFPIYGKTSWGARTLDGSDQAASEWKYIPVRRLALFLEESLFRGTKWVVFEPNDEPLWAKIRMNLGAFMMRLFRQGAFQGSTPDKAFYVKCDAETTPQSDRDLGIVNIEVGFAPLKPAEFVIIKIQQIAGDLS